jgi:hypothetical protein
MSMSFRTLLVAAAACNAGITAAPALAQFQQPGSEIGGAYDQRIIREVIVNGHFSSDDPYRGVAIELPRDIDSGWPN